MFKPRPKQREVLDYRRGKMGVSAVPGSGKTATLSYLAAHLVATVDLDDDQEVLVVTLVKSAVGHFAASMSRYLREEFNLLPGLGYRVRTLHSLANDIVRERPGLVGLADNFVVIDERDADELLQDAVDTWVRANPGAADDFLSDDQMANNQTRTNRWPDAVKNISNNFIRQAKDLELTDIQTRTLLGRYGAGLTLAEMCCDIYDQYERGLRYRGAVDFQDLIRLALRILTLDTHYLESLRYRWPYILEDEAQDSSHLQEQILRLLSGDNGNWVRVGDPNQAIYETFTTANPKYLRDFLGERGVSAKTLPNSGRSTTSIIKLANHLINWSLDHPHPDLRLKLPLTPPYIEPTPPDDPQGNPPDMPQSIHLRADSYASADERAAIVQSLQKWLPDNQDKTVAVLLPINASGATLVQELRKAGIEYIENLKSTTGARAVVGALSFILEYLTDPHSALALANAYRVWRRDERGDEEAEKSITSVMAEFRKLVNVEEFLWPRANDWLDEKGLPGENAELYDHLLRFRTMARRWQAAADLPIDQL
ncbi:MAG: ATP-dependent helicase, partial [Burkholderiales bacterium]|nr:ATP-dependent helicase [Anaerolineae bacterium]